MDMQADSEEATNSTISKFEELIFLLCENGVAGTRATLSHSVPTWLEKLTVEERKEIASKTRDGCAPLFIACKKGHLEIVEYLITKCHADIEQRGKYEVIDDQTVRYVTPLWCASVNAHLPVVKCLVEHGADVNAVSDSGCTPVRSACFVTRIDIVSYLVENGADIHKPNYSGGTCLINSVQSIPLCAFLLDHGADVNATDIQNKTALHYAIQELRLDTTKFLLEHKADPYIQSRYNNDALQTACLNGATEIFYYLVQTVPYSPERLADAHELMGSTLFDKYNNIYKAYQYWKTALKIRRDNAVNGIPLAKRPEMPRHHYYRNATEFTTFEELHAIDADIDAMRVQSLLICERILGPYHKDTLARLVLRGAFYVHSFRYQDCIDLWLHALEMKVQKDSILHTDTYICANALLTLMMDLNEKTVEERIRDREQPRFCDIVTMFNLLSAQLTKVRPLLEKRPVYNRQRYNYEQILKCVVHLIFLLVEKGNTEEEKAMTRELVGNLVRRNPRSIYTGDTLLHLCVERMNTLIRNYSDVPDHLYKNSPIFEVVKLLLECGASVNARNDARSTPLYIASNRHNFHNLLTKLLLDHGAHLDTPNLAGETPIQLIASNPLNSVNLLKYTTLQCYAAQTIRKYGIQYTDLPTTLHDFLRLHRE